MRSSVALFVSVCLLVGCDSDQRNWNRHPVSVGVAAPQVVETSGPNAHWVSALTTAATYSVSIASGADGNVWYANQDDGSINRFTPSGTLTTFPLPSSTSLPLMIKRGPQSSLWFTEITAGIGKITTSGQITEYPDPISQRIHRYISPGPDNNLWVTASDSHITNPVVEKISPLGQYLATYYLPDGPNAPWIVSGPGGKLWLTAYNGGAVATLSTQGVFTPIATVPGFAQRLAIGPDKNVWVVSDNPDYISRITPAGAVTSFPFPINCGGCGLADITIGPDKNLWWTAEAGFIGSITTNGKYKVLTVPFQYQPVWIIAGPDRNIWFSEAHQLDVYVRLLMAVVPSAITFIGVGDSRTITVSEVFHHGRWWASSSNTAVVTVAPGPALNKFTATAVGSGSAVITIADGMQNYFPVNVTVP